MKERFSMQSPARNQPRLTRRDVLNRVAATAAGLSVGGVLGASNGTEVARATIVAPPVAPIMTSAVERQTVRASGTSELPLSTTTYGLTKHPVKLIGTESGARLDQITPANITLWLLPSDPIPQAVLIKFVRELASTASNATGQQYKPNVLLPTHYGNKFPAGRPTAQDLKITSLADVTTRRRQIEAQGVGFGAWGVPRDTNDAGLAAAVANAAGYYVADVEPGPKFWIPGDNSAASQQWVDAFHSKSTLDPSNVAVTLIPSRFQLTWGDETLQAWTSLGTQICVEMYGGPKTRQPIPASDKYTYPNLWPLPSYFMIDMRVRSWAKTWTSWQTLTTVVPIMDYANFADDIQVFDRLSDSNVHVWFDRPTTPAPSVAPEEWTA